MKSILKNKAWISWVVYFCLFFLLVTGLDWWRSRDISGMAAPLLEGRLLSGESVSISDYRGKPVLVYFWATWCPICRVSSSSINSLAEDYPVLTVATNSGSAAEITQYMQEQELTFHVLLDETGEWAKNWGIKGVPTSFILDSDNTISAATSGFSSETGLRIRLWLAQD